MTLKEKAQISFQKEKIRLAENYYSFSLEQLNLAKQDCENAKILLDDLKTQLTELTVIKKIREKKK